MSHTWCISMVMLTLLRSRVAVFEDNGGDCHHRSVPSLANSIE